ncbi:hypothetical protein [Brevibacillus fulvus]|uniref:Uncharacterized protein n=1 Tax=Brevibacillus fulvus TaxID=1125967 RepID=A0A938XZI6_9BACL|nr:hypothetical protein [Brevibacillus fulvus]MBM7588777.1 hypothetical protein [Brevibacillus fulvus]
MLEQLLAILKDYWLLVLLVIAVITVLQIVLRSIFRFTSIFVTIGAVMVLVLNYTPEQVIKLGRSMVEQTNQALHSTVLPILNAELKDATYQFHDDGTYEVKTASLRIVGKKGDPTATIYYKDKQFKVDLSDLGEVLQRQVEQGGGQM